MHQNRHLVNTIERSYSYDLLLMYISTDNEILLLLIGLFDSLAIDNALMTVDD